MPNDNSNDNSFTILENKSIGRNVARFRKFKEKKAFEVAEYIGIGEAAYTKYERGESKITIEFLQKVGQFLNIDPLALITSSEGHVVENITNSPFAINGSVTTTNHQQNEAILKLIDNVVEMNNRVIELLEKGTKTGGS